MYKIQMTTYKEAGNVYSSFLSGVYNWEEAKAICKYWSQKNNLPGYEKIDGSYQTWEPIYVSE